MVDGPSPHNDRVIDTLKRSLRQKGVTGPSESELRDAYERCSGLRARNHRQLYVVSDDDSAGAREETPPRQSARGARHDPNARDG